MTKLFLDLELFCESESDFEKLNQSVFEIEDYYYSLAEIL